MLHYLTKILTSKLSSVHPKKRYIYAVTGGIYLGELLVYISTKKGQNVHSFLVLPEMKIREIPIDKFNLGVKERIVDVVEKLPKYAYKACVAQYFKNTAQA